MRFAFATALGVAPVRFGLAAMGAGLSSTGHWLVAALARGITLLLATGAFILRKWRSRRGLARLGLEAASRHDSGGTPMLAWTRSRASSERPSPCASWRR